jgi:transposase
MCAAAGIILAFLPPYSPDKNPIESSFADLKAWFKRYRDLLPVYTADHGNEDGFQRFVQQGVKEIAQRAGLHFRSCGIAVD